LEKISYKKKIWGGKTMSEKKLRQNLYGAFKNRALMYHHIFDELRKQVGEKKAEAVMKKAIHKRGLVVGKQLAKYAPNDFKGLAKAFIGWDPDNGKMFKAEVLRCDDEALDLKFHGCPLRDAWQEAGLSDKETAKICSLAAAVDIGTFEGAGFEFFAETWKPEFGSCCFLHIRPGKKTKTPAKKKMKKS
jgi:L-2-amino-thiazoline-4-carboxylic acid hydrolase